MATATIEKACECGSTDFLQNAEGLDTCTVCGLIKVGVPFSVSEAELYDDKLSTRKRLVHNTPGELITSFNHKEVKENAAKWCRLQKIQARINYKSGVINHNHVDKENEIFLASLIQDIGIDGRVASFSKQVLGEIIRLDRNKEIGILSRKTHRGVNKVFIATLVMLIDARANIVPFYDEQILACLKQSKEIDLIRLSRKINAYKRIIGSFLESRDDLSSRKFSDDARIEYYLRQLGLALFKNTIKRFVCDIMDAYKRHNLILSMLVTACAKIVYSWYGIGERVNATSSTVKKYIKIIESITGFLISPVIEASNVNEEISQVNDSLTIINRNGIRIVKKRVTKEEAFPKGFIDTDMRVALGIEDISTKTIDIVDGRSGLVFQGKFISRGRLGGVAPFIRSHHDIKEGMFFTIRSSKDGSKILLDYSTNKNDEAFFIRKSSFVVRRNNSFYQKILNDDVSNEIDKALDYLSTVDLPRLQVVQEMIQGIAPIAVTGSIASEITTRCPFFDHEGNPSFKSSDAMVIVTERVEQLIRELA